VAAGVLVAIDDVTVGALPDMIKFTKGCGTLLTANEGEAGADPDGVFSNPEGSVSIIDVDAVLGGADPAVRRLTHTV
jgi:hypothetical protein